MQRIKRYLPIFLKFLFMLGVFYCPAILYAEVENQISLQDIEAAPIRFASIPHGLIEYDRFGFGDPPILLISGFASGLSGWDSSFLITLAQKHEVIVFDNPDIGGSFMVESKYTGHDLADDVYALILQLHLKKPVVLGMSMGGVIAMTLGVRYPQSVGALVLISTAIAGAESIKPSKAVQQAIMHTPKNKLGRYFLALRLMAPPAWWVTVLREFEFHRFQPVDDPTDPVNVSGAALKQQFALLKHWGIDNAMAEKIAQLPMPVLVLTGGQDAVVPTVNSDILEQVIPHSTLIRWQAAGHSLTYQYPVETAAAINEFIATMQNAMPPKATITK